MIVYDNLRFPFILALFCQYMPRTRLTITLSPEIIRALDNVVDKKTIRNRSHAIECLLSQQILSKVTTVVILAGGAGVSMQPFTLEMPKAMLPIHNEPVLLHTLKSLREAGLKNIIISVGHLGDKIKQAFGDGNKLGLKISYVEQKSEKGTAQPLKALRTLIGPEPFLLIYGDVLAELAWMDLINFHHSHDVAATLALTSVAETRGWGVVSMNGNRVTEFVEKPAVVARSHLIFAGVALIDPKILDNITSEMRSFEAELLSGLVHKKKMVGYVFSGSWFDVGRPDDYGRALKEWPAANS